MNPLIFTFLLRDPTLRAYQKERARIALHAKHKQVSLLA